MKRTIVVSLSIVISATLAAAFAGFGIAQKMPAPPQTVISPVKAMSLGAAKAHGKALSVTLEFDEGHWVYGVIVVSGKTLQEVELDPATGKVGDVEKIDPAGEGKELTSQLNKAIGQ